MAQDERVHASLRLENYKLKREVEDLKKLMCIVKHNMELRSMLRSFSSASDGTKDKFSDPKRLLGEIGFQLDRRIISHIFYDQTRLYGFTVQNIRDKITEVSTHPLTGWVDEAYKWELIKRHVRLMQQLSSLGYNQTLHPPFTEFIVNTYGILQQRPDSQTAQELSYNKRDCLRDVIFRTAPASLLKDLLLLLSCLCFMADEDGQPLLLW